MFSKIISNIRKLYPKTNQDFNLKYVDHSTLLENNTQFCPQSSKTVFQ